MARTYKRDNIGRFAGSAGGGSGGAARARPPLKSSGGKASGSRRPTGSKQRSKRKLSSRQKKILVGVGVGVGVGVAGNLAMRKALPSQTFNKSVKMVTGKQERVDFSKHSAATKVTDGPLTYSTYSSKTGKGLKTKYTTDTIISRGANPIGIVSSYRRPGMRSNIVQGTYLIPANRKKGIGSKALTAHAAHDPNRAHRASMRRSVQGQAFARSQGAAGKRTSGSKKEGNKITQQMNAEWKANRGSYSDVAKTVTSYSKGGATRTVNINAMKNSKKLKKGLR